MRLDEILRVQIMGEPVPAPRPRHTKRGGVYMPKTYRDYRTALGAAFALSLQTQSGLREPVDEEVHLMLAVYRRSRRHADVDNYAKTVMDAGIGVVWRDDFQIVRLVVDRVQVEREPRVEIIAYRLLDLEALPSVSDATAP